MKLHSLKQMQSLINSSLLKDDVLITGFSVDTRLINKGDVFFALPGQKVDGHEFLNEAVQKGASCLVVQKNYSGPNFGIPVLAVDDTLSSLQLLGQRLLAKRNSKIVAITGSVGKTTTKDFLTTILKEKYKTWSTPGNANSQIGIPLSILNNTDGSEEILVIEMGMNEPSQIEKLVRIAPPDVAVLTHVSLTHAGNFNSLRDIALEKAEIFKSTKTKIGIVNYDIEHINEILTIGSCRKLKFSVACRQADFYLDHFTLHTLEYGFLHLNLPPLFGKAHYQNLTAAIGAATQFGISFEEISRAEKKLKLPEKRFEVIDKQGITFVNDSYNASEIAVKAAFESLPLPKNSGKTFAVIGEMLELGKFSIECHRRVGEMGLEHVDYMFVLGNECAPIYECWKENKKPVEWFLDRSLLAKALKSKVHSGDVVLLKGSRANLLWKILEDF